MPTQNSQPWSNNTVFKTARNKVKWPVDIWQSMVGYPFQVMEAAIEKAQGCRMAVHVWGTISSVCTAERKEQRLCELAVG